MEQFPVYLIFGFMIGWGCCFFHFKTKLEATERMLQEATKENKNLKVGLVAAVAVVVIVLSMMMASKGSPSSGRAEASRSSHVSK